MTATASRTNWGGISASAPHSMAVRRGCRAPGVFHPTWSDNRLGLLQLWTAAIAVHRAVTRQGDSQLDGLEDIGNVLGLIGRSF
jgi:hypothetical protein